MQTSGAIRASIAVSRHDGKQAGTRLLYGGASNIQKDSAAVTSEVSSRRSRRRALIDTNNTAQVPNTFKQSSAHLVPLMLQVESSARGAISSG